MANFDLFSILQNLNPEYGQDTLTGFRPDFPAQTDQRLGGSKKIPITQADLDAIGQMPPKYWQSHGRNLFLGGGSSTIDILKNPTGEWSKPGDMPGTPTFAPPKPPLQLPANSIGGIIEPPNSTYPARQTGGGGIIDRLKAVDPRMWFGLANAVAPNSIGGRIGANMTGLLTQQKEEGNRDLIRNTQLMELGMRLRQMANMEQPIGANPYGLDPTMTGDRAKLLKDIVPFNVGMSTVGRLMLERDKLPKGDSRRAIYDEAITKNTEGTGTNQSVEQLISGGLEQQLGRKPTSNEILDAMKNREIEIAKDKGALSQEIKGSGIDVQGIADAIGEGQDARVAVKGSMGNPVASKAQSLVLKKYPKFDFTKSDANYKWANSSVNMRTISYLEGSLPRLAMLAEQSKKLGNADFNVWNKVWNEVNKQFGKPEVTNFESNRNAIVQEINTALSGSSTGSDLRVKIELENLSTARSPQQMIGAIGNLREALLARLDANMSPLYPKEVIQGKKTIEQFQNEVRKKYLGDYKEHKLEESTGGITTGGEVPPANLLKEGINTTFKNGQVWSLQNGQAVRIK